MVVARCPDRGCRRLNGSGGGRVIDLAEGSGSHMRPAAATHNRIGHRRGGYAAMLAMLFLALFSTLAIGFYAQTNTGTQMAENDRRIALAQAAAESGMDLMRYELAHIVIP